MNVIIINTCRVYRSSPGSFFYRKEGILWRRYFAGAASDMTDILMQRVSDGHNGRYELKMPGIARTGTGPDEEAARDCDLSPGRERSIICRQCGNIITSPDEVIEIDGSHVHTFMNPSGFVFTIGCYKNAQGCVTRGYPTADFTWFSGFSWSVSLCSLCFNHLGWYYQSDLSAFYGLILENLSENIT